MSTHVIRFRRETESLPDITCLSQICADKITETREKNTPRRLSESHCGCVWLLKAVRPACRPEKMRKESPRLARRRMAGWRLTLNPNCSCGTKEPGIRSRFTTVGAKQDTRILEINYRPARPSISRPSGFARRTIAPHKSSNAADVNKSIVGRIKRAGRRPCESSGHAEVGAGRLGRAR